MEELVTELARLHGIGRKTAQRLTFHLLKQPAEHAERLAQAIRRVRDQVTACGTCGNLTDEDPRAICRDPRRGAAPLCGVGGAADGAAAPRTARVRGGHPGPGGRLSPPDGRGPPAPPLDPPRART